MTAAERQRRHRRKLRKEKRDAEVMATRAGNQAVFKDPEYWRRKAEKDAEASTRDEAERREWLALYGRPPLPGADGPAADELARQIDEYLAEHPGLTIDEVRAALNRDSAHDNVAQTAYRGARLNGIEGVGQAKGPDLLSYTEEQVDQIERALFDEVSETTGALREASKKLPVTFSTRPKLRLVVDNG